MSEIRYTVIHSSLDRDMFILETDKKKIAANKLVLLRALEVANPDKTKQELLNSLQLDEFVRGPDGGIRPC